MKHLKSKKTTGLKSGNQDINLNSAVTDEELELYWEVYFENLEETHRETNF